MLASSFMFEVWTWWTKLQFCISWTMLNLPLGLWAIYYKSLTWIHGILEDSLTIHHHLGWPFPAGFRSLAYRTSGSKTPHPAPRQSLVTGMDAKTPYRWFYMVINCPSILLMRAPAQPDGVAWGHTSLLLYKLPKQTFTFLFYPFSSLVFEIAFPDMARTWPIRSASFRWPFQGGVVWESQEMRRKHIGLAYLYRLPLVKVLSQI